MRYQRVENTSRRTQYANCSDDLELLEVALPGEFETVIIDG